MVTGNGNATIVDAVYSTADKAMPHQLGVTLESSAGGVSAPVHTLPLPACSPQRARAVKLRPEWIWQVYMKGQSSNLRYSGPGGSNKSTLPCSPFTCEAQPAPDGECVNNQLDDLGALLPGDGHSHSLCQVEHRAVWVAVQSDLPHACAPQCAPTKSCIASKHIPRAGANGEPPHPLCLCVPHRRPQR